MNRLLQICLSCRHFSHTTDTHIEVLENGETGELYVEENIYCALEKIISPLGIMQGKRAGGIMCGKGGGLVYKYDSQENYEKGGVCADCVMRLEQTVMNQERGVV